MRRVSTWLLAILLACLVLWAGAIMRAETAPTLTSEQRLTLENRLLRFQLAKEQLEGYVRELQQPGYNLDLNTMAYVPRADPK